jgi:hypothetical protein
MTATALLGEIEATGIVLQAEGGRVRADIPAGANLGPFRSVSRRTRRRSTENCCNARLLRRRARVRSTSTANATIALGSSGTRCQSRKWMWLRWSFHWTRVGTG